MTANLKELTDFRAALDEHAIVAITDARGKIIYVNDKFCAISGYSREELLGQDHRIINSGHHPKTFIRTLWETISSGRVWHGEIKNRAKDGALYWVDTSIVPFRDQHGTPVQYIAIRTDITESKRMEHNLRATTAQLQEVNKELESFSYSVSHDLRAPLRAVDGFSRILLEEYASKLDEEGKRLLGIVRENTVRMGQLIDDLLTFSRLGRKPMERDSVEMTAIVRRAIEDLKAAEPERGVRVTVENLPDAYGDRAMIRQVWINLLSNAFKYTRKTPAPHVEIRGWINGGEFVYEVSDNGAGFDMRHAEKLFGVFQRLHSQSEFEGTGVGLALAKKIVTRHGGSIEADAAPGRGATFKFTLPARPGEKRTMYERDGGHPPRGGHAGG